MVLDNWTSKCKKKKEPRQDLNPSQKLAQNNHRTKR